MTSSLPSDIDSVSCDEPGKRIQCCPENLFATGVFWPRYSPGKLYPVLLCQLPRTPSQKKKPYDRIRPFSTSIIHKGFIDRLHVNFDILVIFISLFFCTFFMRGESVMRSVFIIIPRISTVWVTAYVCTEERYRPQRDSNPLPPVSYGSQPRYQ